MRPHPDLVPQAKAARATELIAACRWQITFLAYI